MFVVSNSLVLEFVFPHISAREAARGPCCPSASLHAAPARLCFRSTSVPGSGAAVGHAQKCLRRGEASWGCAALRKMQQLFP